MGTLWAPRRSPAGSMLTPRPPAAFMWDPQQALCAPQWAPCGTLSTFHTGPLAGPHSTRTALSPLGVTRSLLGVSWNLLGVPHGAHWGSHRAFRESHMEPAGGDTDPNGGDTQIPVGVPWIPPGSHMNPAGGHTQGSHTDPNEGPTEPAGSSAWSLSGSHTDINEGPTWILQGTPHRSQRGPRPGPTVPCSP